MVAHGVFGGALARGGESRGGESRGFGAMSRGQAINLCAAGSPGPTDRRLSLFSAARLSIFGRTFGRAGSRLSKKD
jgi:hypothetical protein